MKYTEEYVYVVFSCEIMKAVFEKVFKLEEDAKKWVEDNKSHYNMLWYEKKEIQ